MKKLLVSLVATAAFSSGAALAADIPVKAPRAPEVWSWTGFYVGSYAGYAWSDRNATTTDPCLPGVGTACTVGALANGNYNVAPASRFSMRGPFSGLTAGYNMQWGQMVGGIELEGGLMSVKKTGVFNCPTPAAGCSAGAGLTVNDTFAVSKYSGYGVAALRLGVTWDKWLLYVKGGGVGVRESNGVVDVCQGTPCSNATIDTRSNRDVWGFAAGGGAEWMLTSQLSAKVEYLYLGIRNTHTTVGTCGPLCNAGFANQPMTSVTHDPGLHTVKVGLNWRLGAPVTARY